MKSKLVERNGIYRLYRGNQMIVTAHNVAQMRKMVGDIYGREVVFNDNEATLNQDGEQVRSVTLERINE